MYEKKRDSNFELMRIFAMFLIVWNHLCNSIFYNLSLPLNYNTIISKSLYFWTGNLGNYLFIFLSGYFISDSKFSWKKVFQIWFQVFSISTIIGFIFYIFHVPLISGNVNSLGFSTEPIIFSSKQFGGRELIRSLFPTLFGNNWFASTYLLFYFFTLFLNEVNRVLDEKKHRYLIIVMTLFGTVIYMIPGQGIFESNNLFYFILGYFIANYIKKYDPKILKNQKINFAMSIILAFLFIVWIIAVLILRNKFSVINSRFVEFFCYPFSLTRFPILFHSIFVFSFFKNLKITYNKILNLVASTTFGVYLIHENPFFRGVLWHKIFRINCFIDSKFLFLYMIFAVVVTFLCCSIIDLLRKRLLERNVLKLFDKMQRIKK